MKVSNIFSGNKGRNSPYHLVLGFASLTLSSFLLFFNPTKTIPTLSPSNSVSRRTANNIKDERWLQDLPDIPNPGAWNSWIGPIEEPTSSSTGGFGWFETCNGVKKTWVRTGTVCMAASATYSCGGHVRVSAGVDIEFPYSWPNFEFESMYVSPDSDVCEACRVFVCFEATQKKTSESGTCEKWTTGIEGTTTRTYSWGPTDGVPVPDLASVDISPNCVEANDKCDCTPTSAPTPKPTCPPGTPAGQNCDPIILGIKGQVFKFEGKSDAWYANLAVSDLVQWNTYFHKFPDCPQGEDTFVIGTGISVPGDVISVEVVDANSFFLGCPKQDSVCLADGSLSLAINGNKVTSPGEYPLQNGGSVIVHNTFAACSRKWFDFDENMSTESLPKMYSDTSSRRLSSRSARQVNAMDLLQQKKGDMIDPDECSGWLNERLGNNDLFSQQGGWATIHVVTPLISFHMEYRQTRKICHSHILDSWISEVSPDLLDQTWKGILGETRYPKYDENGKQIMSDRNLLLAGKIDEDYEVHDRFGTQFKALDHHFVAEKERQLAGCSEL